jgi:MFS transporter, DHA1 family, multidrug resistance protein
LTMSFFLIGYALGQLPYGPLANRFGRKPAIYIGAAIAILGNFFCIIAGHGNSFWGLVIARFFAALGTSVGLKISLTMIGDSFEQHKARKMLSYCMLSVAILPAFATWLGGVLTSALGWISCFYFLTAYSFLILFVSLMLPETAKLLDRKALNISKIKEGYRHQLVNLKVLLPAIIMGSSGAFMYLFASGGPFIGIKIIKLSPQEYGLLNLIPWTGTALASIVSAKIAHLIPTTRAILIGIICTILGTALILVPFAFGYINVLSLFLPSFVFYFGACLNFSNGSSLALDHSHDKSNTSAILNFINIGISVIAVLIFEGVHPEKPIILPLFFVALCIAMILFYMRLMRSFRVSGSK